MLACSFLIESSSKLLVTRTGIISWSSSILGQMRPLILELLAFEWQKFHTFELNYLWSQLANLSQILCVASLGWGKGCIRFWGRLTLAHWTQVSDRCSLGYLCLFWTFRSNKLNFNTTGVPFQTETWPSPSQLTFMTVDSVKSFTKLWLTHHLTSTEFEKYMYTESCL